jgi:hypothetical protein
MEPAGAMYCKKSRPPSPIAPVFGFFFGFSANRPTTGAARAGAGLHVVQARCDATH